MIIRRSAKILRARAAEAVGSGRFSRPALDELDVQMLAHLPERQGTFLEIGANDGYSFSNTYYLERRRGWSGILIEPQPNLARICRRVRPRSQCFNFACVDDPGLTEVRLISPDSDLMAVTLGQQSADDERSRLPDGPGSKVAVVPATTLSRVIDDAGSPSIDFMSIDVEGAEMAVLGGLDWARHTPQYLLVETDYPEKVDELVGERMSRIAQLSRHDHLWQTNQPDSGEAGSRRVL